MQCGIQAVGALAVRSRRYWGKNTVSISYPLSYTLYGTALERCLDSSVAGMEVANHAIPHPAWTAPRAPRPQRLKGSRVLREGEQMRMMTRLVPGGSPVFVKCRRIGDAQHEGVLGGIS